MYSTQGPAPLGMTSSDYHLRAAEYHEDAAESHRNSAAHHDYGNYQAANEQAQLAKECGRLAIQNCDMAMR